MMMSELGGGQIRNRNHEITQNLQKWVAIVIKQRVILIHDTQPSVRKVYARMWLEHAACVRLRSLIFGPSAP